MTAELNEHYQETKRIIDTITVDHADAGKKKCAIFVMVQNEKVFLPIWLNYYSRFFQTEDIFVYDHKSSDGSVEAARKEFNIKPIRLEYPYSFDHQWFQFVAENTQARLLEFYDYVIFTDIDEILFVNNREYQGLGDYIRRLKHGAVKCEGYELIHHRKKEKAFDFNKPILAQRKYWYRAHLYDKTLLTSAPLNWAIGFHHITGEDAVQDKDLLLIHLHKLDYEMCRQKTFERSKLPWSKTDLEKEWGWQNRITDAEKFENYFYTWPKELKIKKIPRKIRKTKLF